MKFSISSLVSTLDPHQPSSFAVGLDDIINILVREIKFILFYEKNDHIRKILKTVLQVL
jgi:hypothetical protein